ncbi:uncharacterized protein LOC126367655 [Pectinophora gossypiella]|uniref:uncharacterized protein LOC126367655 n=1 Tax=Pectinophora gossypiella TaxID=13191 RepID=UPI00214EC591|nr:uncharacterized protein LOC126367655 [Pectinophora gossypiella]
MSTTTAETVIDQLESLLDLITKAQTNFKKCPKTRLTRGYLEARLKCVDEYWHNFHTGHQELFKMTTKQERSTMPYFVEDRYSQCEEIYLNLKADISDLLHISMAPKPLMSTSSSSPLKGTSQTEKIVEVKLPRINLPNYSGAYEEWQSFEDTFTSLIHNNKCLSDVQKLHYLKSCVIGEAKNTIKHFQVTERNYKPAWESLKSRYSQKRLIVNAILKRLFLLKKMTTQSSVQLKALIDNTKECLNSLKSLNIVIESWDPVIIFLLVQKLDQDSHKEWENYVSERNAATLPTQSQFFQFLESRICTLELTTAISTPREKPKVQTITASAATTASTPTCRICNEQHYLCHCKEFGKWSAERRSEYAKENHLCYNCLAIGHSVFNCRQGTTCKICNKRHHSLLHSFKKKEDSVNAEQTSLHANIADDQEDDTDIVGVSVATHFSNAKHHRALLATAIVPVRNSSGQSTILRALVDQGSQATFVSERAAQMLKLKKSPIRGTVTGVGSTKTKVSHVVQLEVLSSYEKSFMLPIRAYVLSTQLTSHLPCKKITPMKWSHLDGLNLADPEYFTPGKIDMLLGIDVYTEILKNNLIKGPPGTPCAQETSLGWILFGNISDAHSEEETVVMHHHLDLDIHDILKNMWDVEHTNKRKFTAEEKLCEEIYDTTQSRTSDGRYVVKIPLKTNDTVKEVGETRNIALKRLNHLERKFEKNPKLKQEYKKVIEEYIELNHMEEVPEEKKNNPAIYLPHHAVLREDKETTKLRVVFDGSCKGSNNKSFNEEQLVGPQLQEDLRSILMRWRMKPICFVADIQKMYRQILVTKEDVDYQRLLWKNDNREEAKEYRLLRVTFGTSSAPYLAVKTLMQLAEDEGNEKGYSRIARVIKEDFFVDDCMSGCDTLEEAKEVSKELTRVLQKGGFTLQKWASNSTEFMNEIHPSLRCANANKAIHSERVTKTLGLTWNMATDSFHYLTSLSTLPETISKRSVLADVQRLFDPLGWLGPAIIPAKMFIQKLWLHGCYWDDVLSKDLEEEWLRLRESFKHLERVQIDRWLNTREDETCVTLHGFCDASEKGYCAVVYSRAESMCHGIKSRLIASRTRVAPIRPVSIPRLELLGALLLAQLLTFVREAMRISKDKIFAWTDSTVVLSWINGDPNRWKTYVSNRVVEILDNTDKEQWFHVTSDENPADLGSRGTTLQLLIKNKLWWSGPEWLQNKDIQFRRPNITPTNIESKKDLQANLKIENPEREELNYDTLQELLKVIVYCKKFLNSKRNPEKIDQKITTEEFEDAMISCIRISQGKEYKEELERLKTNRPVKRSSKLRSLNPYLDSHNIIRVGGRLRNSDLDESAKHPIVLGNKDQLTQLILADAHKRTLHGGIQLMLCYLRSKYWIIHAKNSVKAYIHKCIVCARMKALNRVQIMGDLPSVRTTQARPFLHSGVDFAGPLSILMSKGRGAKSLKAYIAIFICMATKAIHLELVGDLTSEAFIGAFHRFVARRGRCTHIWSDQGRNFIGAEKELLNAWNDAKLELPDDLVEKLASDGTQWHFIPPYSPNFGGLWEAGVKSVKFHLKRVLVANLTFEEMTTTLCQIEACLNSRPLTCIDTTDTDVIEPLTPGHFLIGEAPVNIPSPDLRDVNVGRLSRWQLTQRLVRDFWHRWQSEYLTRLQERPKWMKHQKEFDLGDIVLLKNDQLPPGKWSLGRIVEKHPGKDNVTRVYSIKSNGNVIKRSVSKICALPIDKS